MLVEANAPNFPAIYTVPYISLQVSKLLVALYTYIPDSSLNIIDLPT